MINKNKLAMILLSSALFAGDNKEVVKDEINFDFTWGSNNNQGNAFVPRAESNKLYDDISQNWEAISKTFGSIFFSNILPLGLQLKQLTNLLKTDEKFQTLVKNNTQKILEFATPLVVEIADEAAKVAGYQSKDEAPKA